MADCARRIAVPAEYKTVTKQVVTTPAAQRESDVPAEYKTETRRVVRKPATFQEIEVPAEYKTITKQVLKTPATSREIEIPAEYKTVTKRVQSAVGTETIAVPAEYKTITKTVVDQPAQTREIAVPAEYKTVTYKKLVRKGGFTEWKEVLCQDKITVSKVREVQAALKVKGYDPGPIDNVLGSLTKAALIKFQKDNGLPIGSLDLKTLNALGVSSN